MDNLKPIMPDMSKIKRMKLKRFDRDQILAALELIPIYHIPEMIVGEFDSKPIEIKFTVLKSLRFMARLLSWAKYIPFINSKVRLVSSMAGELLYSATDNYLDRANQ